MPLACEVVSVHILATDIVLAHANVAAELVAASALELIAVVVLALHRLLSAPFGLQHLLPGAAHALPQHCPPFPWHGKPSPFTLWQQMSPLPTHAPPQHLSPPAQLNLVPPWLQCTGGRRRREASSEDALCVLRSSMLRNAKSAISSPPHSPASEQSASPFVTATMPMRRASVTRGFKAIVNETVRRASRFCPC